jgi:DNA modification methylase
MTAVVLRGDAAHLPLPDGSVDLIVTSPPYWKQRDYRDGGESLAGQIGSEATPGEYIANLLKCTREWMRVLKPTGSLFVNICDAFSSGQRLDNEFTVEDAAWLGGVIDSDGSISIHKQGTSYSAWVRVGQMRPEVVTRICDVTGIGTVCEDKRGCYHWQAAAQQASAILCRIWPWLHIKQRQALAGVELQERKAVVGGKGRWNALTDDELRHRERIRQAVLAWNAGERDDYEPPLLPLPNLPMRARWIPPKSLLLLPGRYAIGCMDDLGLILREEIIWDKANGLPESVQDRTQRSHEQVVHRVKQGSYFAAMDEIREPHAEASLSRYRSGFGQTTYSAETDKRYRTEALAANPRGKLPGSVWKIPSAPLVVPESLGIQHFAAYPPELCRRIILGWSPSGICLECGGGRFPVSYARPVASKSWALAQRSGRSWHGDGDSPTRALGTPAAARERRILGYACTCTPYTDHPRTTGRERTGQGYARETGRDAHPHGGVGVLPRTGPWREYHLEGWIAPPTRPAVVLDPFGGTGTAALVADVLGRIGISGDRSMDYARLAVWRTRDPGERARALGVRKPPPVPEGQGSLFDEETS